MSGEALEFAEFFAAAWPRLFRTVYGMAGTRDDAEEALQTAFTKALTQWRRVSRLEHPEAYVRRMAINEAISGHRRSKRRTASLTRLSPSREMEAPDADRLDVWDAVRTLPPRQRAVIVLRYYEGLSEVEIADVLGCRPGTVKSQAADALARLRHRYPDLHPLASGDTS